MKDGSANEGDIKAVTVLEAKEEADALGDAVLNRLPEILTERVGLNESEGLAPVRVPEAELEETGADAVNESEMLGGSEAMEKVGVPVPVSGGLMD